MDRTRTWLAGVDGGPDRDDPQAVAADFEEAFRRTYLRFHRRDGKRSELPAASRAVLTHLAHAGPLTVGELAGHLDRAQSVVSDIVAGLEAKGLLHRDRDPQDRRRTLVWLTDEALVLLARDREVLSTDLLARAVARMAPADRDALLHGVRALLAADDVPDHPHGEGERT